MQRAEMEELRQRDANLTALQAIGPRKKPKLENDTATAAAVSIKIKIYIYYVQKKSIHCGAISDFEEVSMRMLPQKSIKII